MPLLLGSRRSLLRPAVLIPSISSLLHFWSFDSTPNDQIGGADHTPSGSPGYAAGNQYANALDLDGSTESASVALPADIDFGRTDNWTAVAWIYITTFPTTDPLDYHYIMGNSRNQFQGGWSYAMNQAKQVFLNLAANADGLAQHHSGTLTTADTWHMVAAGYDADNDQAFIRRNGYATETFANTFGCDTKGSGTHYAGKDPTGTAQWFFEGRLGPQMVFNTVLSDKELDTLYNDGAGLTLAEMR